MIFLIYYLLFSFTSPWDNFFKALEEENLDPKGSIEIYKNFEKKGGSVGALANYKLIILDVENGFNWFKILLHKNPPKTILESSYKTLIERKDKDAIKNFDGLNKRFSLKFRKEMEREILKLKYEENKKDGLKILREAFLKDERAYLHIGKDMFNNSFNFSMEDLKKLFEISLKFRDLQFCKILLEKIPLDKFKEKEYFYLGRYYFFEKDYEKSFYYFNLMENNKGLFQKARVKLFQGKEDEALKILKEIKGELFDEATALILRISLKNGNLEEAINYLKNIKKSYLKKQSILNCAIHYNFYGKKKLALNLIKNLKKDREVLYWEKRFKDEINLSFSPEDSPFSFFHKKEFPLFQREDNNLNLNFKPEGFLEFLIFKGYFKEGLFFKDSLKFNRELKAKIFLKEKRYREAISEIYPLASQTLKKDISQWNPSILRIFFPKPYEDIVSKLSKEYKIPKNLIWAIMRQESYFKEDAFSSQGAMGVMQVLPQNYLKYMEDLENPFEIEKNIRVSLKYLKDLKNQLNEWVYVISAYNAGEDAVSLWLKDPITVDFPSFYTTIPYVETKTYLKNVLYNWMLYKILYGEENEGF